MSKNNENSQGSFHICLIGIDLKKTTMKSLEYPPSLPGFVDSIHFVNKNPGGVLLYIYLIGIGLK